MQIAEGGMWAEPVEQGYTDLQAKKVSLILPVCSASLASGQGLP